MRARRELGSELACVLRIPERTAETLIEDSRMLTHELPATFDALSTGTISWRHARSIVDHAASLPEHERGSFESRVLPHAESLTVAKFDRRARAERERVAPETIVERHVKAVDDRHMNVSPARDGMMWLNAFLPAVAAMGIDNRVCELAARLQTKHERRTLTQLRADVLAELLSDGVMCSGAPHFGQENTVLASSGLASSGLAGIASIAGIAGSDPEHSPSEDSGSGSSFHETSGLGDSLPEIGAHRRHETGIRAKVFVTVPVMTMLGKSNEPAMLEGYGPIDPESARELAADAPSFTRLLTHPETGTVLSVGRDRYSPPADLRIWLQIRDGTCRFPGCSRRARRCDLDHIEEWQFDGETAHENLAHLCPMHHHLKHATGWSYEHVANGVLEWTAPSGRTYRTDPETLMEPVPGRSHTAQRDSSMDDATDDATDDAE